MIEDAMKQHGAVSWNELIASDIAGAKAFYGELLGWTLEDVVDGDMTYTMIKYGDRQIGGMMPTPPELASKPAHWGTYITVDNVDTSTLRAEKLGAKIIIQPRDIHDVGRFSVIEDPLGATFALITYSNKA